MAVGKLTIDLDAIVANWRALDAMSGRAVETAAVIKADAYGLGIEGVGPALMNAGARTFFVAAAEEGVALRRVLGDGAEIYVFSGHMAGDTDKLAGSRLIPLLNAPDQWARHRDALPDHPFGIQLDTGMNRLGFEDDDWADLRNGILTKAPRLIMSHLACADEPDHSVNQRQLNAFKAMTEGCAVPRSLAATGGTILGPEYHFDMTRPGVGLYGGLPFADAAPVARLSLPVIQTREVLAGEIVGYGASYNADCPRIIATVAAGYADGLLRAMSGKAQLFAGLTACPLAGRVSMDMLTVDVTELDQVPDVLDILCPSQGIDDLAGFAGTIGYEILTSLGHRYDRSYAGAGL